LIIILKDNNLFKIDFYNYSMPLEDYFPFSDRDKKGHLKVFYEPSKKKNSQTGDVLYCLAVTDREGNTIVEWSNPLSVKEFCERAESFYREISEHRGYHIKEYSLPL